MSGVETLGVGDLVRIRGRKELEAEGRTMSTYCGITCYEGSIAEIVHAGGAGYKITPVNLITHFDPREHGVFDIDYYTWHFSSVEPYEDDGTDDNGFMDVF